MILYGYWRSSAAYRVRIALHLKQLPFESKSVHLVKNGGEQHSSEYLALNSTELVPTLIDGDLKLHQSMSIIRYLDEKYPTIPLYPTSIEQRAIADAIALDVACEIHPLNNLRVQQFLASEFSLSENEKLSWQHHWMHKGFSAIEIQLAKTSGLYCVGDKITVADLCLVPQVYNAKRFALDMSAYPIIEKIVAQCNLHPAFIAALPENQPDAQ